MQSKVASTVLCRPPTATVYRGLLLLSSLGRCHCTGIPSSTVFLYFVQKFFGNNRNTVCNFKNTGFDLFEKKKNELEVNAVKRLGAGIEVKCEVYIGLLFSGIIQNYFVPSM